ncbi:pimeloyl-ACP methyl ester carboxylesterase [Rhodococcus sp. 27YEA15]|uniref:alpha/beta fold hydrolase n=1 Tax=Rhodococcus sp. 27YEA15 TaxID=3156259 RepID=UPI003C7C9540
MELTRVAVGSGSCTVRIDGPVSKHAVLLLPGDNDPVDLYDDVCERLHNSDLRTVAVESIENLDERTAVVLLNELNIAWVNLVGRGAGADLAWLLAARQFGRFASLISVDRGHPSVDGVDGVPAVEVPTTIVVGSAGRALADASGRFVYSDFRVTEIPGANDVVVDAPAELATEIVLRTSPW